MASSVPLVVPAFKTLAASALPVGTQIVHSTILPIYQPGPGEVSGQASGMTLQITGVHFSADEFAELGPTYRHEEHYSLLCTLIAWVGVAQDDYAQLTQDVYAAYDDLLVAISNDFTLGLTTPIPRIAWPRQLDFTTGPDAFGRPAAIITFEIQVQARVPSLS
jgi:hypothetical protein